ncbi:putative aliphatic sulfonates-binding protein precursor [Streptomyces sp. YIM 130001]|uniref:NrtA/SsuA/CpmA family ABC transporter substrate-binding protein n=1 Tax=Streptomyces sp. YIM 130001 TaxID=2259644 RepID=UPI000E6472E8|nr:NrtA/SsuA/CpmA family ABC transporter substrate-binding protein [Streptomyces sp. YIM 130001]RII13718.1 putative aliphatic sulfonates-binding protein precursor [Streptomyces sp. YIM 130001]
MRIPSTPARIPRTSRAPRTSRDPRTPRVPRTAVVALASAVALAALSGCGTSEADSSAGSGGKQVTVRIPDPGNAGVLAAGKKDGSLDKALGKVNAKVAWTGSSGPFEPSAQAMNADQLDVATGSITSGITSLTQTPGFKFFTATAPDGAGEGILARKGSGIDSVKDLVGRKVAVNKGGTGEYLLLKALAEEGIPPDKVERVYLRPDQTASVFNTGKVDAWAVWAAYSVSELGTGKAHFVTDGKTIGSDNYSLTAVRTEFAKQHPEVVKALYRYLHDGSVRQKKDPAAYLNVNTDGGPQALTGKAKSVQIDFIRQGGTVEPVTDQDVARFEEAAEFYAEQKVTRTKVDVAEHILDIGKL